MTQRKDLVQIGEFAKLAGTNLRTLRYYEELGLLAPASRSDGGFRYYEKAQLDRMTAIKRLQDLGLSLKEIAAAVVVDGNGDDDIVSRLRGALERQITLTDTRIKKLAADLEELQDCRKRLLEMCASCNATFSREHCDPCPRDHEPMPAVLRALL